jgi:hypothetical protein
MTTNELAKIRLAIAIRATLRISSKVLFYVCKTMKNGSLWVAYKIDGVKCSTFVSRSKFEEYIMQASNSKESIDTYTEYVKGLAANYSNITVEYFMGCIHVTKITPNRIKDIKTNYVIAYDKDSGVCRLGVDMGYGGAGYAPLKIQTVNTYPTVKEAIVYLASK